MSAGLVEGRCASGAARPPSVALAFAQLHSARLTRPARRPGALLRAPSALPRDASCAVLPARRCVLRPPPYATRRSRTTATARRHSLVALHQPYASASSPLGTPQGDWRRGEWGGPRAEMGGRQPISQAGERGIAAARWRQVAETVVIRRVWQACAGGSGRPAGRSEPPTSERGGRPRAHTPPRSFELTHGPAVRVGEASRRGWYNQTARAPVAQRIERRPPEPKAVGSNPSGRATNPAPSRSSAASPASRAPTITPVLPNYRHERCAAPLSSRRMELHHRSPPVRL